MHIVHFLVYNWNYPVVSQVYFSSSTPTLLYVTASKIFTCNYKQLQAKESFVAQSDKVKDRKELFVDARRFSIVPIFWLWPLTQIILSTCCVLLLC